MWILLTLTAVILWSFVNIADSYLVEKNKKIGHPIGSLVIFSSVFAFVVSISIYLVLGNNLFLSLQHVGLLIIAGFCNLLWIVFYLYALVDDDVSSVIPWFLSVPLFGYILGYFILGETLNTHQIIGGVIVLIGGLILSIKITQVESKHRYRVKWKPIVLMLIASVLVALWGVLFKFAAYDTGFWSATFWGHIGLGIAGILVLVFVTRYRKGFLVMLRTSGRNILLVNTFSEIVTIIGNLFANYALLLVPVTLVYIFGVSQPVIVFMLGIICTLFFPQILTEDISRKNLFHKGISIAVMSIGAIVLLL